MHRLNEDEVQNDGKSALYDHFAAILLAYLCQMVSNRQDAEDLLLEVFMAAFNNETLSGLPARRQLAWLRHVAQNKVVDRYRHAAHLIMLPVDQAIGTEDEGLSPQQYAEQQQTYECLSQAFAQLSPIQQELIRLRYGRDLRLTQIAEMFEKPAGTLTGAHSQQRSCPNRHAPRHKALGIHRECPRLRNCGGKPGLLARDRISA